MSNASLKPIFNFCYYNSLGRQYDNKIENVIKISFAISRYGAHGITLNFSTPKTEAEAISCAQKYLSGPLTEEIYEKVKDDLFACLDFKDASKELKTIGHCLGDCKFLEIIESEPIPDSENVQLFLTCGS